MAHTTGDGAMLVRGRAERKPDGSGYTVIPTAIWSRFFGRYIELTPELIADMTAAGRDWTELSDGDGGFLFPPGTPPELVDAARVMLDDADAPHDVDATR